MQISNSGGLNDTEVNELAVKPSGCPAAVLAVTTVTPVGKAPKALLS